MAKISSMSAAYSKTLSKDLIKRVKKSIRTAYAPYSKIQVAAGLFCGGGNIYTGINIENRSYSLSMCAERIAIFKALSEGEKKFQLMLLYSPQIDFIMPCGACLQVLNEFAPDIMIVTMNGKEEFKFYPLQTLLTKPFEL